MKNPISRPPVSGDRGSSLVNIVSWSQKLACEVLRPGDLAIDLTAGKGRDTLALAKAVGIEGQVVAFDLQPTAIEQTRELLQCYDFATANWPAEQILTKQPGIFLIQACHSTLDKVLTDPAQVIIANLGYLPGGDKSLTTRPASTLAALQQSVEQLSSGGRLVVTVYPVHPGGTEEGEAVSSFFKELPAPHWQVLCLRVANCTEAPYLLVAERVS